MAFRRYFVAILICLSLAAGTGYGLWKKGQAAPSMTAAATAFVATLDDKQKQVAVLDFDNTERRVLWHFIPREMIKYELKGMEVRDMSAPQKEAAFALLKSCLSKVGYDKARKIMELEHILHVLEKERGTNRFTRDPGFYFVTIYGQPAADGKWGFSIEGHHLSLNFVIDKNEVVSSTPSFFAANPATVMNEVKDGLAKGTRVLKNEEQLGFDLVNSLSQEQRATAILADKAPKEIRDAGTPQPPTAAAEGIAYKELTKDQRNLLEKLIVAYAENMPTEVRDARFQALTTAGMSKIHFAWAGALKPGIGHYYRVQGPTFLIEFVNTQPDPAGNPANHIHCVWRDMNGDFAVPIK